MAAPVRAGVITYTTPPGATQDSFPVNVSATFTTGTDSLHIVINNLGANPTSVIQNLSDLEFVIGGGPTVVGQNGGITSSSGTERSVAKAGKGTNNPYTDGGTVATGWGLRQSFALPFGLGTGFSLCVICPLGGTLVSEPTVNPEHTIIGPADASNFYTNANGSIADNAGHNPFLFGPVTFDLTIVGLTSASTIGGVVFSFGTTAEGSDTQGVCTQGPCGGTSITSVPMLSSVMMVGLGTVIGGSVLVRSRWRRARAVAGVAS